MTADTSTFWLRITVLLYAFGLIQSLLSILGRKNTFYGFALAMFRIGVVLHGVAIVEAALAHGRLQVENFYGTLNICAFFLWQLVFLLVDWKIHLPARPWHRFRRRFRYIGGSKWSARCRRGRMNACATRWLIGHIVLVLAGYAALLLTAVSVFYLVQERCLSQVGAELARKTAASRNAR